MNKKISVVGLGKLGSSMLAAYASKGYSVIGIDINPDFVKAVNEGRAPVEETDLQRFITENKERVSATQSYKEAIKKSEITFVIVPTPTDVTGGFSIEYVLRASADIGKALAEKDSYHLVVLTSTVLPLDCEEKIIPVIEESSGKKCGVDFGFCYSPEFIAIGSVIRDLLNPDFFLVGEYDKKSGDILESFYATIANNGAPVRRMNIPSAELTKISLNHFLTTKITFANMLAEVAGKIPNVNVDIVTGALGSDSRIGSKYLKGGLGYGGPCFPRDNRAFAYMAEKRGVEVPFAQHTDDYNNSIVKKMVSQIVKYAKPESKIGVLGLSYKPGTGFCEESQGLNIAKNLANEGYGVIVFEPNGHYHARALLNNTVVYAEDLESFLESSDIVFLTNWDKSNNVLKEKHFNTNKVIIDPWRHFTHQDFSSKVVYVPVGVGSINAI